MRTFFRFSLALLLLAPLPALAADDFVIYEHEWLANNLTTLGAFAQEPYDLLDLAERFDRMALYVERRYPERRSILSPPDKAT